MFWGSDEVAINRLGHQRQLTLNPKTFSFFQKMNFLAVTKGLFVEICPCANLLLFWKTSQFSYFLAIQHVVFFLFFLIRRKTKGNDKYAQSDNKDIEVGIGWSKKAFSRRKKNVQENLAMQ